ncbi:MAG: FxLYD domain-containing protein [Pseudomonadales bacterium]|nr:FxLYD domain-containing protein [Pseudomonadales bacterium]
MSDRTISIIIGIAILALIGYLVKVTYFEEVAPPAEVVVVKEEAPKKKPGVRAAVEDCSQRDGRTEMTGYVENVGNTRLSFVTVTTLWKNAQGLVIERGTVYVVQEDILNPGERRSFHDVSEKTTVVKCNVEVADWWGE